LCLWSSWVIRRPRPTACTGGAVAVGPGEAAFLDDADRQLIAKRPCVHNRLGFALLVTTVRYLGVFLTDPLDVPDGVAGYLAGQLGISDPGCVRRYTARRTTRFEHADEIKAAYGLREFEAVEKDLRGWVDARAWTTSDGHVPYSSVLTRGHDAGRARTSGIDNQGLSGRVS
jgi:hypothetical protein